MENGFCYRLDLVVRLVDTTAGGPVTQRQVRFLLNDREVSFFPKGAGIYVLINAGRKEGSLSVAVKGYLKTAVDIRYEEGKGRYPEVYVELIPERPRYGICNFTDISGNLPGISSIAAVCLTKPFATALSYHAGKRQIKLLQAKELEEKAYALIHAQEETFEEFRVLPGKNKLLLRLEDPLETELRPEEEISRIVRGLTDEAGNYLLRLRGDGRGMQYLVRYVVKDRLRFEKVAADIADGKENGRLEWG